MIGALVLTPALYGVLAEAKALGLVMVEVRHSGHHADHRDRVTAAHRDTR